jgi:hypothetical protein
MFDERFINVLDEGAGRTDLTASLRFVFALLSLAAARGPYTLYISRGCDFSGTLAALNPPPRVQFRWVFAPGAVVSLRAGAELEIDGDVELTTGTHFRGAAIGSVRLRGSLPGVRPEWFGAADDPDTAVRHALAVIVDRFVAQREQVPLLASGSYRLRSPLILGVPPTEQGARMEVRIEGRHPYGDSATPPTFLVDAAAPEATALVAGRGVQLRLRHVAFRSDAPSAPEDALLRLDGMNDGTEIDRCSFFVSGGVGVQLTSQGGRPTVRSFEPTVIAGELSTVLERQHTVLEVDQVAIRESWFESIAGASSLPDLIRIEGATPRCRLSLDRCAFRGAVRAMVASCAGTLLLTSCSFDVTGVAGPEQGADLLLGTLALEASLPVVTGAVHLIETHTRTSSLRHLFCERVLGGSDSVVSITGLRQTASVEASRSSDFIRWRGPIGGGLLLQGCSVAGRVVLDSAVDRIVVLATNERVAAAAEIAGAEPPVWTGMVS